MGTGFCGPPADSENQKRALARLGDVLHEARMKVAADKASKDAHAASEAEEGEVM